MHLKRRKEECDGKASVRRHRLILSVSHEVKSVAEAKEETSASRKPVRKDVSIFLSCDSDEEGNKCRWSDSHLGLNASASAFAIHGMRQLSVTSPRPRQKQGACITFAHVAHTLGE